MVFPFLAGFSTFYVLDVTLILSFLILKMQDSSTLAGSSRTAASLADGFFTARVLTSEELLPDNPEGRSSRLIKLDLSGAPEALYEPGQIRDQAMTYPADVIACAAAARIRDGKMFLYANCSIPHSPPFLPAAFQTRVACYEKCNEGTVLYWSNTCWAPWFLSIGRLKYSKRTRMLCRRKHDVVNLPLPQSSVNLMLASR